MVVDNSCRQSAAQHCSQSAGTTLRQIVDNIDQIVHFLRLYAPFLAMCYAVHIIFACRALSVQCLD